VDDRTDDCASGAMMPLAPAAEVQKTTFSDDCRQPGGPLYGAGLMGEMGQPELRDFLQRETNHAVQADPFSPFPEKFRLSRSPDC
jgi:hypothetical protein